MARFLFAKLADLILFIPKIVCVALCFISCIAAYADDQLSADWSLDIDAAHQQQDIANYTATSTNLVIAPDVTFGNWDLSLVVPWYEIQGEFYINGVRPRLVTRCERLTGLTPARQRILIERGKITQKQLNKCEKILATLAEFNETHNGIGDITAFSRYRFAWSEDSNWGTSFGLGYKADTGDSETGIGSGTRDGLLELGIFYHPDTFSFSANLGYDLMSGDDSVADVYQTRNYAYANFNISKDLSGWLTIGASFNVQQAYLVNEPETKIVTGYIDLTPWDKINVHFYLSQYSGANFLPDKEMGANISYSF